MVLTGTSNNSFWRISESFWFRTSSDKGALGWAKADLSSLSKRKYFLLAAQKQLLELPYEVISCYVVG